MLSTTSQYALRALVQLARHRQGEAVLGRELAESADIPAQYLSKIMLALRNAGFVTTARGTGGGYRLARPVRDIHLGEVVELFDGPATNGNCLLGSHRKCSDKDPCTAHGAWHELRLGYIEFLHKTTLNDISGADAPANQEGQQP